MGLFSFYKKALCVRACVRATCDFHLCLEMTVRTRYKYCMCAYEKVLRIPYVRGLNDEKGSMRRVEMTRRGFEAAEFDEEGVQPDEEDSRPRKPDEEAQTDEKGPTRSLV